jgi:cold shock protein
MLGTVKWFNHIKGYGFVLPNDGGKDVFVHVTAVQAAGLRGLSEGHAVAFDVQEKDGKLVAVNLRA